MQFDILGYLQAAWGDWVSLMTGVASILFTAFGFSLNPKNQKRLFWGIGLLCFLVTSVRVWTIEHQQRLSETAYLEPNIELYYPNAEFPVGREVKDIVQWKNRGEHRASNPQFGAAKMFIIETKKAAQHAAIEQWIKIYQDSVRHTKTVETAPILPNGNSFDVTAEGPILTAEESKLLFQDHTRIIMSVGAVQYSDGSGRFEAHDCKWLRSLVDVGGVARVEWADCDEYVLPRRLD